MKKLIISLALIAAAVSSVAHAEIVYPKAGHYFCSNGYSLTVSDSDATVSIFDEEKKGAQYEVMGSQPVDGVASYINGKEVVQVISFPEDSTVTVNFGHGFDFECAKSH